MKTVFCMRYEI